MPDRAQVPATAAAGARQHDDPHADGMSVLVAAVADGVIGQDEAGVLASRLVRADDAAARERLAELPAGWLRLHRSATAAQVHQDSDDAEAWAHLRTMTTVFLGVTLLCVVIWASTGFGYAWPVWPALGTSIPVVIAYTQVRSRHRDSAT